ncbi:MAG TPA: D-cysteine desulfhydrase family protein [Polyangiaceae bacterium]|jgi:D-cysteine desulfhydrase|nr:D-cysteine desulfhydrase family protein [Polyangiaceae bacterium]
MTGLPRIALVHGPTPVVKRPGLDAFTGVDLWVKRDDATGGAEAGNKVRKLEFLLGDAVARGADTIITCGGLQSNHARATALSCAALGLRCVLFLRVEDPRTARLPAAGNVLLDRMAGAEVRLISHGEYAQRGAVMESAAIELRDEGRAPYVVPEGGSSGLGALGYVECMRETAGQMARGLAGGRAPFDVVVHACGSGGTAAGIALGAARHGVARSVRAMAVSDDAAYFERVVMRVMGEARAWDPTLGEPVPLVVDDAARGPAYAVSTPEQRRTIFHVARSGGLVLDPVYSGKAMHGLKAAVDRGDIAGGARVLFVHTGGLPGLLAQGDGFEAELA